MLNKTLAGFFAFFLGMFGVHRFYLGQWFRGVMQFAGFFGAIVLVNLVNDSDGEVFFGMVIATMVIAPIITAIVFWATPEKKWLKKYDKDSLGENQPLGIAAPYAHRDTKALKAEGIRYYRTGDYDLAIEAFTEASEADLGDPGTHFNLACSYAQLGQYGESLRHLELSVTFGLPKPERIEKHPALAALRKHSSYRSFRANNFRRLNLLELTEPKATDTPIVDETETIENFNAPPPPRTTETMPPPPPAFDAPPPGPDLLEQITRLRELHDAGVLTQKEYQMQKEKLMG
ncbi:NINE protein [Neolewinella aurantiaca]|uniref:NINE protein n=1 Tax=Neolewinella aurantiaca TaxID=2602767 RepID=A0A5C7F6E1_9BACT|nr:NINE protein [Neolewinella aurantiaca]TXF86291.1 NINE protein [Neolewinella aurantiaca]